MVKYCAGELVAILNEHHADLNASLVDILLLEAEGSNSNSRKIRFEKISRPHTCAQSTGDSLVYVLLKVVVVS
jgi:hypothetical protein